MGQFVKIGTTAELEDLEAGKLVEAGGKRIAIFKPRGEILRDRGYLPPSGRTSISGDAGRGRGYLPVARFPIQSKNRRGPHTAGATEREGFSGARRRK